VTSLAPASAAVSRAYQEELGPGQRSALLSWLEFSVTFAGLRALTYSIRLGKGPFRNISVGGEHLYHYMRGIAQLSGVGAVAVRGDEEHRRHPAVAVSYGSGLALIVDEFALILDLKDVHWARQGRISIDVGVGAIALTGSYFAAPSASQTEARPERESGRGHGDGHKVSHELAAPFRWRLLRRHRRIGDLDFLEASRAGEGEMSG
jgi:hypothetical protein